MRWIFLAAVVTLLLVAASPGWADGNIVVSVNPSNGSFGSVTAPAPSGSPGGSPGVAINCPAVQCTADYNNSQSVTLTANPTDTNITVSWVLSGGHASPSTCANGTTCTFTHTGSGGGNTEDVAVTFTQPVPTTTSISPTHANAGGAQFTLTVNGTNFTHQSVVNWNGAALTTTWMSATQLTATVPASDLATTGGIPITVTNPAPGGGTSNSQTFTVNAVRRGQTIEGLMLAPDFVFPGNLGCISDENRFIAVSQQG